MENILNSVSIGKAKEILIPFAEMASRGIKPLNVMLHGSPGLGKSSIIREIAEEFGFGLIDLRLSAIDPSAVLGLPYVNNGELKFSTPDWLLETLNSDRPYILFLDELNNANLSTQAAAYRLVLDRTIQNGTALPDNCWIVGAGNLATDKSGAKSLSSALANRFALHLFIDKKQASESFISHAIKNRFDRSIVGYLSYKKVSVSVPYSNNPSFATPRTWEFVNDFLKHGMFDESNLGITIAGAVGSDIATDFLAYREVNGRLPDWDKLKHDDDYVYELPNNDEALKYAISVGLAFELLDSLAEDDEKAVKNLATFLDGFNDEITIITFRTMKKDQKTMVKLVRHKELLSQLRQISKYINGID